MELFSLPSNVSSRIFSTWLDLKSVVSVDSAMCNHSAKSHLIQLLSCKGLVHLSPVLLRSPEMLQWLCSRSFRVAEIYFSGETKLSCSMIQYFASFGDSLRGVHFGGKCDDTELMYLLAGYCRNLTVLRCTNVTISYAFHALLLNNPNIQEIWVHNATCTVKGLMENLSFQKLHVLSINDMDCPKGFPWSGSTYSSSLQRVECSMLESYVEDMQALTTNCPNIRSFSSNGICVESEDLISYLTSRPEIVNLNISANHLVIDNAVLFMAQNLHYLRTLNLQKCARLTILSLSYVAEYCTLLEILYIDLRGASRTTEQVVETFSTECNKLTYLNIGSDFVLCTTTCSLSLINGCPALQTLVINKYENITPTTRGFCALVKPQLKILVHDTRTEYNVLTMPV